jgi:hypothetical protein
VPTPDQPTPDQPTPDQVSNSTASPPRRSGKQTFQTLFYRSTRGSTFDMNRQLQRSAGARSLTYTNLKETQKKKQKFSWKEIIGGIFAALTVVGLFLGILGLTNDSSSTKNAGTACLLSGFVGMTCVMMYKTKEKEQTDVKST